MKLQKKAVRLILNKHHKSHADPLFKHLGLLKIGDLLNLAKLKFFYSHHYGFLPMRLQTIPLRSNSDVHGHFTRQCTEAHRTHCHNRSLRAMLEQGVKNSSFPQYMVDLLDFRTNTCTKKCIVRRFKNQVLESYSDVEICADLKCYHCGKLVKI